MELPKSNSPQDHKNVKILNQLLSKRNQLREINARKAAIADELLKYQKANDDLFVPVSNLYKQVVVNIGYMEENLMFLQHIKGVGEAVSDLLKAKSGEVAEKGRKMLHLQSQELSDLLCNLNVYNEDYNFLKNDASLKSQKLLDLDKEIADLTAVEKQQTSSELSSENYSVEINQCISEWNRLQNKHVQLDKHIQSSNLKLHSLHEEGKSLMENSIGKEAEHHVQLTKFKNITRELNALNIKYKQKLDKNEQLVSKMDLIEKQRAEKTEKLKSKSDQYQEMYAKSKCDFNKITNKMNNEFGDAEFFEKKILGADVELVNLEEECCALENNFKEVEERRNQLVEQKSKKMEKSTYVQNLVSDDAVESSNQVDDDDVSKHKFLQPNNLDERRRVKKIRKRRSPSIPDAPDSSMSSSSQMGSLDEGVRKSRNALNLIRKHLL